MYGVTGEALVRAMRRRPHLYGVGHSDPSVPPHEGGGTAQGTIARERPSDGRAPPRAPGPTGHTDQRIDISTLCHQGIRARVRAGQYGPTNHGHGSGRFNYLPTCSSTEPVQRQ
jgi:hypothetical protein